MPQSQPRLPTATRNLQELLALVTEARHRVEQERECAPGHHSAARDARRELHACLELYAAGLAAIGRPLPYRLRDELRLYRSLDLSS